MSMFGPWYPSVAVKKKTKRQYFFINNTAEVLDTDNTDSSWIWKLMTENHKEQIVQKSSKMWNDRKEVSYPTQYLKCPGDVHAAEELLVKESITPLVCILRILIKTWLW